MSSCNGQQTSGPAHSICQRRYSPRKPADGGLQQPAPPRREMRLAACRTLLEGPEIEQFLAISGGAMQHSAPSAGARGVDFA